MFRGLGKMLRMLKMIWKFTLTLHVTHLPQSQLPNLQLGSHVSLLISKFLLLQTPFPSERSAEAGRTWVEMLELGLGVSLDRDPHCSVLLSPLCPVNF